MSESAFEQIVKLVEPGSKILTQRSLGGGLSCAMTAIEIERVDGSRHELVVRHVNQWSLDNYPESVNNEMALMTYLKEHGISVATPRFADTSNSILERPYLVLDYVEGSTDLTTSDRTGRAVKMADALVDLHLLDPSDPVFGFMEPSKANIRPASEPPDETLHESKVREHLERLFPRVVENPYVFRHGDFWPGNALWKNGDLVAMIDWEETSIGDPLFDVSLTRLDILWAYGQEGMKAFTDRYQARRDIDYTHLPYWDLRLSLRPMGQIERWAKSFPEMGRSDVTPETMRRDHNWFVDQAISLSQP